MASLVTQVAQFPQSLQQLLEPLNEEQLQAATLPLQSNIQVLAGAGTGKTKLITARVMVLLYHLKSQNPLAPIDNLLWIATFSEKAAEKLQQEVARQYQQVFREPLGSFSSVGTIHSLCKKMLDSSGHSVSSKTLLDDLSRVLFAENLLELILQTPFNSLFERVNSFNTNLDKTFLTQEYFQLLDPNLWFGYGVENYTELLESIIFSLIPKIKAYGYSLKAFYQASMEQSKYSWQYLLNLPTRSSDYHSASYEDIESACIDWQNYFKPYADSQFRLLPTELDFYIRQVKSGKPIPIKQHSILNDNAKLITKSKRFIEYNGVKKIFSSVEKDFSVESKIQEIETHFAGLTTLIYSLYQLLLEQEGALDFDDLILNAQAFLEENSVVSQGYQKQFKAILIDEFQDTNAAQLKLVQLLRGEERKPLTVVGDIKQSIYGFRNAQPENLYQVFSNDEAVEKIYLQTNYRSTPEIVKLANRCCELMSLGKEQYLYPSKNTLPQGSIHWLDTRDKETYLEAYQAEEKWIVESIENKLNESSCKPNDIAILVLDHAKAQTLEEALAKKQIKAYRQKYLGFFDHLLFKGICSLFSLLENPKDDLSFMSLFQSHFTQGVIYALAQAKKQYEKQLEEAEVLEKPSWLEFLGHVLENDSIDDYEISRMKVWLSNWNIFKEATEGQSFDRILEIMVEKGLLELFFTEEACQDQYENIEYLRVALKSWIQASHSKNIPKQDRAFILRCLLKARENNVLEVKLSDELIANQDTVIILTIHASKGLEFPVVYYAGVERNRVLKDSQPICFEPQFNPYKGFGLYLKNFQAKETLKSQFVKGLWLKPRAIMEKQRLEYVAMTRAENELWISSYKTSFEYLNPELFTGLIQFDN